MKIDDLKEISKAPAKGQILVYLRKKVIFESYNSLQEVENMIADSDILEIHLFDEEKEYRAVSSNSHKYSENGFIEWIVSDNMYSDSEIYEENTLTEKGDVIIVHNYISFDNRGMAKMSDYRLTMGGTK